MTLSQLTPLFPGLDLPAILDLLFPKNKRPATARNLSITAVAARTGFLLFLATNRLLYSLPDHISLQLQQPAYVYCRNAQHNAVWTKVFNWGLFFPSN